MTSTLDLADIQGNILEAYGKQGYPKARYFTLNVRDPAKGRRLVEELRSQVTTAVHWSGAPDAPKPPAVTINLAFTFWGLLTLGLPTRTLQGFPDEFIDGLPKRASIIGDEGVAGGVSSWDPVWRRNGAAPSEIDPQDRIHILVTLNAQSPLPGALDDETERLRALCADHSVTILKGHDQAGDADYQDLSVIYTEVGGKPIPTPKEHFGFTDGISDPVFDGQYPPAVEAVKVVGNGKLNDKQTWVPLATGEFLLGYPDEAQEVPGAAMPLEFARNGTFMVYRKLHENVSSFKTYIGKQAETYAKLQKVSVDEARETLMAKFAGRWSDGVPLALAKTYAEWQGPKWRKWNADLQTALATGNSEVALKLYQQITNYDFKDDPNGTACPLTSHTRRVNTRDNLDPNYASDATRAKSTSVLNNRRRILRRGLPYGVSKPEAPDDHGDHGVLMLIVCSSIFRQFEFVQQQWINYGLDFNSGNDTCPMLGKHDEGAKFVIPVDADSGKSPFIAPRLPQFVTTRGGEYFFVPSMTALRMIGMGITDPT